MQAYRAVVTGAGSGIGRAFAVELGRRGSSVLVCDIDPAGAAETVAQVEAAGGRAMAAHCDVRKLEDVEAAADLAARVHGPTNLCINNAGVVVGGQVDTIPMEDWHLSIDVNLFGVIHGVRAFAPRFKAQRHGRFLNVASIAGFIVTPEMAPYNTTKAAVIALSETMSSELGKWNIDTTVLCPTAVRTPIFASMRSDNPLHRRMAEKAASRGAMRTPEEVAHVTLRAVDRGELYVFPQVDGKAAWAVKRLFPSAFVRFSREARTRDWLERFAGRG